MDYTSLTRCHCGVEAADTPYNTLQPRSPQTLGRCVFSHGPVTIRSQCSSMPRHSKDEWQLAQHQAKI